METEYEQTSKIVKDKITASIKVTESKIAEIENVSSGAEVEIAATIVILQIF